MHKFLIFWGLFLFTAIAASSQSTLIFHEDFEPGTSPPDSMTSSQSWIPGVADWAFNTRLHQGDGLRCDSCRVLNNKTFTLESVSFSTIGNTSVVLSFWHICKVDVLDFATIEFSKNGGLSWEALPCSTYLGNNNYCNNGKKFASNSYGQDWLPLISTALPDDSWWHKETFDLSSLIGNCANARLRFKLKDGGPAGGNNNAGWYIDNVRVEISLSELIPPAISFPAPIIQGITFNDGPYTVRAKISDASGIDTAMLVFAIDGGVNDTTGMTYEPADSLWHAQLPALNDSSQLCYYAVARDNAPTQNYGSSLVTMPCIKLHFYGPLKIPYLDDFEDISQLWEAGPETYYSKWQWGTPNYGITNTAHSPSKCWDVNLTYAYYNNANCILLSPYFDFSPAVDARLSFWHNYRTEAGYDGFRMEYTTDKGLSWSILGNGSVSNPDSLGVNWYTDNDINFTGKPAWEGNSQGWKKSEYNLSFLNNMTDTVRFRFVFTSNSGILGDGVSIDDFSISVPGMQEVTLDEIVSPVTGCGLGIEPVTLRVTNSGLSPFSSFTAGYRKDALSTAVNESFTLSNPLNPGDTHTFTMGVPLDLTTIGAGGPINFKAWVHLDGDSLALDDTLWKPVESYAVPEPPFVSDTAVTMGYPVQLTAVSTLPVTWYSAPAGGNILLIGNPFTSPPINSDTAFYAEAISPQGCKSLRAAAHVFATIPILNYSPTPYTDDFEDPAHVMFHANYQSGTRWMYGIPQSIFPGAAHSPSHVWGTNLNNSSGYSNNAACSLTTQAFTMTNPSNPRLSFWQKREISSGDGCWLEYSIDTGNTWNILGIINDTNGTNWYNGTALGKPVWTANTSNWVKSDYKISQVNTTGLINIMFRFNFVSDASLNNKGIFLDDFQFYSTSGIDAGIESFNLPAGTMITGTSSTVEVKIRNYGNTVMTSCPLSYRIGNSPAVTETWNGFLAADETITYLFTTPYSVPLGQYCIMVYTGLLQDSVPLNDTAVQCALGIPLFGLPYSDDFDSAVNYWHTEGPQWERGTPSGTPFSIDSAYTQPHCWKTNIDGPYAKAGEADLLYSPLFDISAGYDSIIFYHWVDIYTGDKAWVEYLAEDLSGNLIWKRMGMMGDPNGYHWYNSGSSGFINDGGIPRWHRSSYDLKVLFDIANPSQFRFNFFCYYPNSTEWAGWAIDHFELTLPEDEYDAGVTQIINPLLSTYNNDTVEVRIKIRNYGNVPLSTIPVQYRIPGMQLVVDETWQGPPLNPNQTVDYTFSQKYNYPFWGYYHLCTRTMLPADAVPGNDSLCHTIESLLAGAISEHSTDDFYILQNIPNPAGSSTEISYNIPHPGEVSFSVFDLLGIDILNQKTFAARGLHSIRLDTGSWPAGTYFYTITYEGKQCRRKMVITR